ncbi:MAG: alpha/beta hydrolase [Chloroflexi bacterium]|nr:alpha/beta hydrolase [Chloroflexota bacterium]
MNSQPTIMRIDHNDPGSKAAVESERRLFAHYGLEYKVHFVELTEPSLRVRVLEVGAGQPLLMVPGGTGEGWQFAALMAELKGWRFICVNRPGGGLSDLVDSRQVDQHRFAVRTLSTVMDAFALKRVPVIGNSMGGLWSFWLALDQPERVSTMVQMGCPALIMNTSAPFFMRLLAVPGINRLIVPNMQPKSVDKALDGLRFQGSRQQDIDAMPKVLAEVAYHFFHLPTYLDSWVTIVSAVATLGGANPKYRLGAEQLKRVQQPVLFVWGDNDPFGGLAAARQAASIVPNAKLHEMRAGHIVHLDNPAECGRVIREFLPLVV